MAEELNLEAVIRSRAETDGFVKTKVAVKDLATTTNAAAPQAAKLAQATKQVGVDAAFTGARVSTLSQEILRNVGAGTKATAIGTGISSAFASIGNQAKYVGAAIGGVTIGVSLLLPLLIQWWNKTKDQSEAQNELRDSIAASLEQLRSYIETVPRATAELKALFEATRAEAIRKQREEIQKLTEEQAKLQKRIEELRNPTVKVISAFQGLEERQRRYRRAVAENQEELVRQEEALELVTTRLNALLAAQYDGYLLGEQISAQTKRAAQEKRDLAKAIREQEAEEKRLAALRERDARAAYKRRIEERRAAAEQKRQEKENTRIAAEKILEYERSRGAITAETRAAVQAKKDERAAMAASAATTGWYITSLFGQNKAARIAQAIADTWAGATRAYADLPWPFSAIASAAIVAAGLANVANIRKAEIGFDDPANDLLAAQLGKKFAVDVLRNINLGFGAGLRQLSGGGSVNNSTTINRGTTIQRLNMSGIIAGNETELLKQLNRKLTRIQRLETRTRLG